MQTSNLAAPPGVRAGSHRAPSTLGLLFPGALDSFGVAPCAEMRLRATEAVCTFIYFVLFAVLAHILPSMNTE